MVITKKLGHINGPRSLRFAPPAIENCTCPFAMINKSFKKFCQNPNHNSTQPQPNITLVGLDVKMTYYATPPHKLNVSNISAAADPILMKL